MFSNEAPDKTKEHSETCNVSGLETSPTYSAVRMFVYLFTLMSGENIKSSALGFSGFENQLGKLYYFVVRNKVVVFIIKNKSSEDLKNHLFWDNSSEETSLLKTSKERTFLQLCSL